VSDAGKKLDPFRGQIRASHLGFGVRKLGTSGWMQADETDDSDISAPKVIRLLVVDDDDVDRERIRRLLSRAQSEYEILDVGSGAEAIDMLLATQLDCVLLDYHLGDMTGTDVLRRINAEGIVTPVIMVTGVGDEQLVVETMRLGVYDYLPKKKLSGKLLSDAIEASLQRAALEQRLAEMQQKLERMSLYDELTGLPNRNLFFDRLNQAILNAERKGGRFALLMMDLNLFKEVNDTLGHEAGDEVLAEIGSRFRQISRKSDTIARLGGDEFTSILHGVDSIEGAVSIARKIIAAVNEPLAVSGNVLQVGVSIGIAVYPSHGDEASSLLTNADHAMYQAKRNLSDYVVYGEHARYPDAASGSVPVSNYLHKAMDEKELYMMYQPKINLVSGAVVGVESLLRWRSPELGRVCPDQFIPFAERSALIERITFATIAMSLDQLSAWQAQGMPSVPVSVNLSARMLDDIGLPDRVLHELESRGLQPADLILEITETALASSKARAKQVLTALAAAGVGISIDDFGSGFTSFRYIRDIDISEIKIDRLFVKNLSEETRDISIVRSIASLSESMDVRVVAEGIESKQNWRLLTELGCIHGQGFCISQPLPAEQFMQWYRAAG
jgi:diguanylate cyclase (GGDEF)-like protein